MTLPARAAAIRGDDYQHAIGAYHACRVLTDPDIATVSVEDADGGAFDDIVVRVRSGCGKPHEYIQTKSSNYNNQIIDEAWLLTARTAKGKSPLQHFHDSWAMLTQAGEPFHLTLLSNRNFAETDDLLSLIDRDTDTIPPAKLEVSNASNVGKALERWATHLKIDVPAVVTFLCGVRLVHGESTNSWADRCAPIMKNAGLRDDPDAVDAMRLMVRQWVTSGAGPQTRDDIRAQVFSRNLLAREGTVVLAVHAIDRISTSDQPNVSVDITDLYPQGEPFELRQLNDPEAWDSIVLPRLDAARDDLRGFRSHRIHIVGSMRLPMYFAVGRTLPDVGKWVLSVDQRGTEWVTTAPRQPAILTVLVDESSENQGDLVVAFALSQDPTSQIRQYLQETNTPPQRLIVLSAESGPDQSVVESAGWAASWVSQARARVLEAIETVSERHVRLFMSCPAALAMFAGHQWNMVPSTTVYEHLAPGYGATMTLNG